MTAKKRKKDQECPVCGKPPAKGAIVISQAHCSCPWGKPFEHWPRKLMNTVQAIVAGGPREP